MAGSEAIDAEAGYAAPLHRRTQTPLTAAEADPEDLLLGLTSIAECCSTLPELLLKLSESLPGRLKHLFFTLKRHALLLERIEERQIPREGAAEQLPAAHELSRTTGAQKEAGDLSTPELASKLELLVETLAELPPASLERRDPLLGLLERSLLGDKRILKRLELEKLTLDVKIEAAEPLDPLLGAALGAALFSRFFPVRGGGGDEQPAEEKHYTRDTLEGQAAEKALERRTTHRLAPPAEGWTRSTISGKTSEEREEERKTDTLR